MSAIENALQLKQAIAGLKSERLKETLSGSARYIFWGVLGIVVVALLVLISRLLPKA